MKQTRELGSFPHDSFPTISAMLMCESDLISLFSLFKLGLRMSLCPNMGWGLSVRNHQPSSHAVLLEQTGKDVHAMSSDYACCIFRLCCKHFSF